MDQKELYKIEKSDVDKCIITLRDAFKHDPVWKEMVRDDPDKDKTLTGFFAVPVLCGMKFGKAYAISNQIEGLAVWAPGEKTYMNILGILISGAMAYGSMIGKSSRKNLSIISKYLNPDRKSNMKGKKYIHLLIIGVNSENQGKGYGGKLLNKIIEECDKKGRYLYLETELEENVRFYEKHGFQVIKKINIIELNVPMWEMVRAPK